MAINTSQIRDLLRPGLREVAGEYKDIPTQYKRVFKTTPSTMQIERTAHVAYMGLAQIKQEGGATGFDNAAGQRWVYNAETYEVGLAYAITRKAIRDDLYKTEFKPTALGLGKAFKEFWEINSFNVLNNGTTYDSSIVGDGKALFATDHPVDGATWANRYSTDATLNEASLMQAIKNIRTNWVDERNLKIMGRARRDGLLVPVALMDVAERITKTELRPGTADNDINADRTVEGGITDYMVCDYLTSNTAWFVLTQNEGLKFFERDPYETDMWVDNTTDNLLVKAYQRAQPTYCDPRAAFASFPS
jgi:phage major head subunit gpT-like protein